MFPWLLLYGKLINKFRVRSNKLIKATFILIVVAYCVAWAVGYQWRDNIIEYDVAGYYGYLPSIINHQDLTFSFLDELSPERQVEINYLNRTPDKKHYFNKYPIGVSFLYLPFYLMALFISWLFNINNDLFSNYYGSFILIGGMIYGLMGIAMLARLLNQYFKDITIALTLFTLAFATNFFNYCVVEGGMSHVYSFFLFAVFLTLSIQYYKSPKWSYAVGLGIILGLIVLVRPTNIIILIPVLFWGIKDKKSFRNRIELIRNNFWYLGLVALFGFCIIFPQMYYWKLMTGEWLYYSYQNEGFNFLNPKIYKGLFSYRKGWLLYTPAMSFALLGFIYLFQRKYRSLLLPIFIFCILNIYIVFSWHSWWYGGGFSARALVESYALLVFPMAVLFERVLTNRKKTPKFALCIVVVMFALFNLFQNFQYTQGILHKGEMTKEAYWHIFGKINPERSRLRELLDIQ